MYGLSEQKYLNLKETKIKSNVRLFFLFKLQKMLTLILWLFRKNCTYCGGDIEDNYPPLGSFPQTNKYK